MSSSNLPYSLVILGIGSILLAVAGTLTGEALGRIDRVIYRNEEPSQFWQTIATYYFVGACFLGYFLYKVYELSN